MALLRPNRAAALRRQCRGRSRASGPQAQGAWVDDIVAAKVEYFATLEDALRAEDLANKQEAPRYAGSNVHDPETPCVYARRDSPYWWYRFSIRGEPFQASTKVTKKAVNKAAAERVAAAERARLMAEVLQ